MEGCSACNSTAECLQCNDGLFYLQGEEENQCVEECPLSTYPDEEGMCLECGPGCEECADSDACDACSRYTKLTNGTCACKFNYDITARPLSHYISVNLYNLVWETETNITSGQRFNCSDVFVFEDESDANFDLSDLRCYGYDLSNDSRLKSKITIRSHYRDVLDLLVNQDVTMRLNETVFTQDCVADENLDLTLKFPRATPSCQTCGFFDEL